MSRELCFSATEDGRVSFSVRTPDPAGRADYDPIERVSVAGAVALRDRLNEVIVVARAKEQASRARALADQKARLARLDQEREALATEIAKTEAALGLPT